MLWTVQHVWMSGGHFFIKCYHHWSLLVLRNGNETAIFLHSREGVMQGGPLVMIMYRIFILPLIPNLKQEISDVTQPWYDDNAGALGMFTRLETYFDSLIYTKAQDWGITQNFPRAYWLYARIIFRLEHCSGHVTDLSYARAHIIWGVALGTTIPNTIGWDNISWRGRKTSS